MTSPVLGSSLASFKSGDDICKRQFGKAAQWAKFNDGYFMAFMNERPYAVWDSWSWSASERGGWNLWGYFNHK